jgi:hypothetical protein
MLLTRPAGRRTVRYGAQRGFREEASRAHGPIMKYVLLMPVVALIPCSPQDTHT